MHRLVMISLRDSWGMLLWAVRMVSVVCRDMGPSPTRLEGPGKVGMTSGSGVLWGMFICRVRVSTGVCLELETRFGAW